MNGLAPRQSDALPEPTNPEVPSLQDVRDQRYIAVVDSALKMTFQSMPDVERMKNAEARRADVVDLDARRGPADDSPPDSGSSPDAQVISFPQK